MTLIETMFSAAILGIGVMSLAQMFYFAEEGTRMTRDQVSANEMARQRLERLSTMPLDVLPQCVVTEGCRRGLDTYAAIKPASSSNYPCTEFVDEMSARDPVPGQQTGAFRIDTMVEAHPGARQQLGSQVLTVSVCWTDSEGQVHEARAQRLLVPEV